MASPPRKTLHWLSPKTRGGCSTNCTIADMKESEEKYRSLINQSVSAIYLHDLEGRFLDVNAVACAYTGFSREELLGMTVFDLNPTGADSLKKDVLGQWSHWRPEQRHTIEMEHRRKEGEVFPVDISTGVVCFAGKCLIPGLIPDTTQCKRAGAALKESEERCKNIVSSMSDTIFVIDEDDRFITVHCPSMETLVLPPEQFLAKETASVMPRHLEELYRNCINDVRQSGEHCFEYILSIAGEARWFVTSRDRHADGRKIVAGVHDVTEHKRAEEALRRAHDELEQRVRALTADLSAVSSELRRERRTLEHMLRASDHERRLIAYDIHDGLAQELAGAVMQFQVYQQQKDARPDDAQKAFDGGMTLLRQGHSEARRLISGVRPPILDESGVVAAIAHLVHDPSFADGPRVHFRSRVTFTRLEPAMENAIYRIVQEGLSNAREHSQSPRIIVSIVQRGNRLRLQVRDWGVGFDPQRVPEDCFGLVGIRERARLLGARCRIRSTPGKGTAIVVDLPVVSPQEAPA